MRYTSVLLVSYALTGCGGKATRPSPPAPKYDGISLTVSCPDTTYLPVVQREAAAWSVATGAKINVVTKEDPLADVVIRPPVEFGAGAAQGEFLTLPQDIRAAGHPNQWLNIGEVYRARMAGWGLQVYGLPLGTEAEILVYRQDRYADKATQNRFQVAMKRALAPPITWEDLAEQAEFFSAEDQRPALPPLQASALLRQFHMLAACYDREAQTTIPKDFVEAFADQTLNFHHVTKTGQPRLTSLGFVTAANMLKRLHVCRVANTMDPVAALAQGKAVLGVVTLSELGRLAAQSTVPVGVTFLPGTRTFVDSRTNRMTLAKSGVNTVPYLGGTGYVGAVRTNSKQADAAYDFLATLAGPSITLKTIGDPVLGFGPWRVEHIAPAARGLWAGYNLDANQTDKLLLAMQPSNAINTIVAPRGPDVAVLMKALEKHLQSAISGTIQPEDALKACEAEWKTIEANYPPADVIRWRRQTAGLN